MHYYYNYYLLHTYASNTGVVDVVIEKKTTAVAVSCCSSHVCDKNIKYTLFFFLFFTSSQ